MTSPIPDPNRSPNTIYPVKKAVKPLEEIRVSESQLSKRNQIDQRRKRKEFGNDLKKLLKKPYQLLQEDDDYLHMRQGIHKKFLNTWSIGFEHYTAGRWEDAKLIFEKTQVFDN